MRKLIAASLLVVTFLVACSRAQKTVTLALLGDMVLGRQVHAQSDSLGFLTSDLRAADLALANLESPLSADPPASPGPYDLCAPAGRSGLLSAWGLDLLALANNHRLDCGPAGVEETRKVLESAGLTGIGPGLPPVIRTVNGLRLAFLAFDDISSPLDGVAAAAAIRSRREAGARVIVYVHWGMEYQSGPSPRQKALAAQFAGAGAVLVVGSHPHVLQPAAWIASAYGKTLVLYSLGNALFDQPGLADTRQSALVLVGLDGEGVRSVRAVPFIIDVAASRVLAADAETGEQIRERLGLR